MFSYVAVLHIQHKKNCRSTSKLLVKDYLSSKNFAKTLSKDCLVTFIEYFLFVSYRRDCIILTLYCAIDIFFVLLLCSQCRCIAIAQLYIRVFRWLCWIVSISFNSANSFYRFDISYLTCFLKKFFASIIFVCRKSIQVEANVCND